MAEHISNYVPGERKAGPVEKEVVVADPANPVELYAVLELFTELNTNKAKYEGELIYRIDEIIREDRIYGKYTVTMVNEWVLNSSRPIMAITCYDLNGKPLANMDNEIIRQGNTLLRAKGLENFAKKRGISLAAARTHIYKPVFKKPEGSEKQKAVAALRKELER